MVVERSVNRIKKSDFFDWYQKW